MYKVFALRLQKRQSNHTNKQTNKQTKQTNKTETRHVKRSLKTQLKNTFYLIKLKLSEAFGEKIFWTDVYVKITIKISSKKPNFTLVS